jgi:uncharacterized ParB-like nuclease family protein
MKINGKTIQAKEFAFDGCHKIYICESADESKEAMQSGFTILPIDQIKNAYENSCSLRFIHNWQLNKTFVSQFTDVVEFT